MNISMPYGLIPNATASSMRRAYFASTSFADSLLGSMIDALDSSGVADETAIVMIGDHGWCVHRASRSIVLRKRP